jgi:hypothetical protein
MDLKKLPEKYSVHIGIISMTLLILGTFAEPGSTTQKMLFLLPAPTLGYTAYVAKQRMFTALQAVVTIGALLAFLPHLPLSVRYIILAISALAGVTYLIKNQYIKIDKYWPLGGIGIFLLAFGYSTNPITDAKNFSILLATGGLLVAAYSAIGYFKLKNKIALIWLILNILFIINPILLIISNTT